MPQIKNEYYISEQRVGHQVGLQTFKNDFGIGFEEQENKLWNMIVVSPFGIDDID